MIIDDQSYLIKPDDAIVPLVTITGQDVHIEFEIQPNAFYTIVVKSVISANGQTADPVIFRISSAYDPLFISLNSIRAEMPLLNASDDELYAAIRNVSMELQSIYGITDPSYAAKQYVKYRAIYDVLINRNLNDMTSSTDRVTLGDFTVEKDSTGNMSKAILAELNKRIQYWQGLLASDSNVPMISKVAPQTFVKGGAAYPDFLTRSF